MTDERPAERAAAERLLAALDDVAALHAKHGEHPLAITTQEARVREIMDALSAERQARSVAERERDEAHYYATEYQQLKDHSEKWSNAAEKVADSTIVLTSTDFLVRLHDDKLVALSRAESAEALVRQLREALRAVEWGPEPIATSSECAWCLRMKSHGHDKDCIVAAALRSGADGSGT